MAKNRVQIKKKVNKKFKIRRNTPIYDISQFNKKASDYLMENYNLHCIGCPLAFLETLEEGLKLHGLNDEEIDKLVEKLNNLKN